MVARKRGRLGMVLAVLITAGCSESAAPSGASPTPTPSSAALALPSASAASTPGSPAGSPSPSVGPVTASTLNVEWSADDPTGIGPVTSVTGVARAGTAYVLIAEPPYSDPESPYVAFWSTDGREWKVAQKFPTGQRIMALTAGGPGFVASGSGNNGGVVWTSVDGRVWQPVSDASLGSGVISRLVATASGVVGFGWGGGNSDVQAIWTSPDGLEWLAATNETGVAVAHGLQAVGSHDGRAVAIVGEDGTNGLAVWETTGRAEWTETGTIKGATSVAELAGGPRGWVAIGESQAWTSTDGRAWSEAVPGPDVASDLIADDSGFIAVGYVGSLPGETCGDQRPFAGHTWTSSDGRVWEQMPVTKEFSSAMVTHLIVVDRTLVGYGQRIKNDGSDALPLARWTAPLPDVTRAADAADKGSLPEGCGG